MSDGGARRGQRWSRAMHPPDGGSDGASDGHPMACQGGPVLVSPKQGEPPTSLPVPPSERSPGVRNQSPRLGARPARRRSPTPATRHRPGPRHDAAKLNKSQCEGNATQWATQRRQCNSMNFTAGDAPGRLWLMVKADVWGKQDQEEWGMCEESTIAEVEQELGEVRRSGAGFCVGSLSADEARAAREGVPAVVRSRGG